MYSPPSVRVDPVLNTHFNLNTLLMSPKKENLRKTMPLPNGNGKSNVQSAPVAVSSAQRFPLKAGTNVRRSWRFQNSELISSVSGTVAFNAVKYPVNPGLSGTFPWLSTEAAKWEQYRFHKLQFRYVTRTSTATVGSVILSPDYNVRDAAPTTEVAATDTQDAVEDSVWKEITCVLDPAAMFPQGPRKLLRSANIAGDANLYDVANFYLCTVEEAGTDAIGKLWVDYDVEFFVPQNSPSDSTAPTATSICYMAAAQTFTNAVAATLNPDNFSYDPLGIGNDSSGVFTPGAGSYLISLQLGVRDTSSETFTGTIELQKNSGTISPYSVVVWAVAGVASATVPIQGFWLANCNGTDTLRFRITMGGAAGTLSVLGDTVVITFRSA